MTKSSRSGRSIEVVPVTADRWDDYNSFFAEHKPDCYCRWPRLAPMTFKPGDPTNRDAVCDPITSGHCPGLLALRDGRPVGWCAVAPQDEYPQYPQPEPGSWGIACITVSERGLGIGRELVRAAVALAADNGATTIDGPPPWWKAGDDARRSATIHVLETNGFDQVGKGERMPILRRHL